MMDKLAREEFERQMAAEEKEMIESKRIENDMRKKRRINEELVKAKIASKNLQVCTVFFPVFKKMLSIIIHALGL